MNKAEARILLASLWDRFERSHESGKWMLNGPVSELERNALRTALASFDVELADDPRPTAQPPGPAPRPQVKLDARCLALPQPLDEDVRLCIDFGTAMSKAFATQGPEHQPIDLALGTRAGYTEAVYPVPSTLFISSDGRIYFGHEALSQSLLDSNPDRELLDSPKQILSQGQFTELKNLVSTRVNPTSTPLTRGDLILLYLSYLTDLACSELESRGHSRYAKRRFAHPCWDEGRMAWALDLLSDMLAGAQILADTFHDRFRDGVDVRDARSALDALSELARPKWLIECGVHEPVAAAASLIVRPGLHRLGFLVVDVGAGTSDFGFFVATNLRGRENFIQAANSARSIRQAGDTIDQCLRKEILSRHPVDPNSAYGKRLQVDLAIKLRGYKERLFRDRTLTYQLADDTTGTLAVDDFLKTEPVKNFSRNLQEELAKTLAAIDKSWIEMLAAKQGLRIVLTGGGARLPMVAALASGPLVSHGVALDRLPERAVPEWITSGYPQFAPEYPQLAVAMGGSMPELTLIKKVYKTYGGGLDHSPVVPGNLPISGA